MKNICFLNGDMSRSGGTERVTAIIANELSKINKEFNVHILSITNNSESSFFKLDSEIKHSRILKGENLNFKAQYIKVVNGIRKYIKENKIDILIDVDVITDIFSIPATRFTKTKLISWEHFNYYENNGTKLRAIARKLSGRFSDYVITLTEKDKENYQKIFSNKKNIEFIYNPIEKLSEIDCDINSKQIISVGRLTYQKGFDMLCDVANQVLKKHKDWKWVILGEGEDRQALEQKIKEYSLQDRLILKGNVSDVESYYKNSSMYVMTSRFEGLPMTLLEAKGYKLPIVSFDCSTGPSDIITDGINGYLVKENDIDNLVNKINELLINTEQRKEFSKNASNDIGKFNLEPIINKWVTVLEKI